MMTTSKAGHERGKQGNGNRSKHGKAGGAGPLARTPQEGVPGRSAPWVKTLGWFSIGLGVAQLAAPRRVSRLIGVDGDDGYTRLALSAVAVREIACGIGLLSRPRPTAWTWARVAGDAMDVALLGCAMPSRRAHRARLLMAVAGLLGVASVDAAAAVKVRRLPELAGPMDRGIHVNQAVSIARSPSDVYGFFRDFQNLPKFMRHLESVTGDNGRSHWRAKGPLGVHIEWDAEIVEDVPGELIAWRSVAGADVPNSGSVRFRQRPGSSDTELFVELAYHPPAGALGAAVAKLFGEEPSQQISAELRRLKQVLETGEVMHSDASVHRRRHPARPSVDAPAFAKELKT